MERVAAAIVKASAQLGDIPKRKTARIEGRGGGSFSYDYADLGDVLAHVRPILSEHGLTVLQNCATDSAAGVVNVTTILLHESGERIEFGALGLPLGATPQQTGSAITYARRYALMAALGLATEDDDGASASVRPHTPTRARPTAQKANEGAPKRPQKAGSPEEIAIRELMAVQTEDDLRLIKDAFVDHFGSGLSELDKGKHGEALEFVRACIADLHEGDPAEA